jgi:hypothetical protein
MHRTLVLALIATGLVTASPAIAANCTRQLGDAKTGSTVAPAITLSPSSNSSQRLVNFGTSRAMKQVSHLTFKSDKPLPDSLAADELDFDTVISRAGDTLESIDFPDPTFTQPRISADRQTITFNACLSPGSIPPGKYVGSITLSGPPGIGAASVALTVNAKVSTLFWLGSILSLAAAFLLMILKDAADQRKATANLGWLAAFGKPLLDPIWWAITLVALATAFGTLYAVYASNPAWGSGGFSDIAALIGAGFAAVGGKTLLSALSPA